MADKVVSKIEGHLERIRDEQRAQSAALERIAAALEAIVKARA